MTPGLVKGRNQITPFEIENTRKLANVRIHVERVIGAVRRKYRILFNLLPISTVKQKNIELSGQAIDEIVVTTCSNKSLFTNNQLR